MSLDPSKEPFLHRGRIALDTPLLFALLFASPPKLSQQLKRSASQASACNHKGAGPVGQNTTAETYSFGSAGRLALCLLAAA